LPIRCSGFLFLAVVLLGIACPGIVGAAPPISFLPPVNYGKPGAGDLTAVDLDGDGKLDLAVIGGGATQASFTPTVAAAAAPEWGAITAAYNGTAKRLALLVRPAGAPLLTIEPGAVIGGGGAVGKLTLPCPAGPDGLVVTLQSSSPSADVRASVTVPPGAGSFLIPILTFKVGAPTPVTLTATVLGQTVTASLQLLPPSPPVPVPAAAPQLVLFPNPVPGGLLALGEVTLPQPAGPGGVVILLTSSSPTVALVPASGVVLPGATRVTFPIVTFPVAAATPVAITAGAASGAATATLLVLPLTVVPSP
jgi:hypothetical protein